jgi:hypothetical protein
VIFHFVRFDQLRGWAGCVAKLARIWAASTAVDDLFRGSEGCVTACGDIGSDMCCLSSLSLERPSSAAEDDLDMADLIMPRSKV